MKKMISAIAALAMVMVMVGCDVEVTFSEQTKILSNSKTSDTAYYITDAEVTSGSDYLEVSVATATDPKNNTVTLKSKKAGDAIVTFKSSVHAKKATVSVTVYSSGSIGGLTKLEYTTFNGTAGSQVQSAWEDDISLKLNPEIADGYYYDNNEDGKYLLIKGNVIIAMGNYNGSYSTGMFYDWARGIVTQSEQLKIGSINWYTKGSCSVTYASKLVKASDETVSSSSSVIPSALQSPSNLSYTYSNGVFSVGTKSYTKMTTADDFDVTEWPDDTTAFIWPVNWVQY